MFHLHCHHFPILILSPCILGSFSNVCLTSLIPITVVSVCIFIMSNAYFTSHMAVWGIILIFNYLVWLYFYGSLLPYFLFVYLFRSILVLHN